MKSKKGAKRNRSILLICVQGYLFISYLRAYIRTDLLALLTYILACILRLLTEQMVGILYYLLTCVLRGLWLPKLFIYVCAYSRTCLSHLLICYWFIDYIKVTYFPSYWLTYWHHICADQHIYVSYLFYLLAYLLTYWVRNLVIWSIQTVCQAVGFNRYYH